jgi:hypothetical protein
MAPKNPPLQLAHGIAKKRQEPAPPPSVEIDGANGELKRPARQQPPTKEEIREWVRELNAGLTTNDAKTVQEAVRLCRRLSLRAAERLALVVTGIQPGTVPPGGDGEHYHPQRGWCDLEERCGGYR